MKRIRLQRKQQRLRGTPIVSRKPRGESDEKSTMSCAPEETRLDSVHRVQWPAVHSELGDSKRGFVYEISYWMRKTWNFLLTVRFFKLLSWKETHDARYKWYIRCIQHLKPIYLINQCPPNTFNKNKRKQIWLKFYYKLFYNKIITSPAPSETFAEFGTLLTGEPAVRICVSMFIAVQRQWSKGRYLHVFFLF